MPAPNNEVIGITKTDLFELIKEIRKPTKTEKEAREEAQAEADRQNMMATLKADAANKLKRQEDCSHMRRDGSTTAVSVECVGKLYCQVCAVWIDPFEKPDLFNRLYQLTI